MKIRNLFLLLLVAFCAASCGSDKDDELLDNLGTHKIVIKLSGDLEYFSTISAFSGSSNKGTAPKYYNSKNELVSAASYTEEDLVEYICTTDASATYLASSITIIGTEADKEIYVEFTAYINNKVVSSYSEKIHSKDVTPVSKSITFETIKK